MGSSKTMAAAELISKIERILDHVNDSPWSSLWRINLAIEDYRAEFHGPKQQAAREKKLAKRRRRLSG